MKLLLLGDLSPTAVTAPLFQKCETETLFGNVREVFKESDFRAVNLECALTDCQTPIQKFGPALSAPKETAQVMKELGVDCCSLSNNHSFDLGIRGIEDTMETLKEQGIAFTGFGRNVQDARKNFVVEQRGQKVCLIAVCEHEYSYALENRMGARPFDEFDTLEDIRNAKQEHERVVVLYHGGKEQCRYPSPRLLKACRAMAKAGADVILCQHSHCVGCYECYENCHILYGQGNFHFVCESDLEGWHDSLAVRYDTERNTVELIPLVSGKEGISLAEGEKKEALLAELEERSLTLKTGEWKKRWHAFCEAMSPVYKRVVQNACAPGNTPRDDAFFGHYLDCEAHTDVLRELFPTWNQTNEIERS